MTNCCNDQVALNSRSLEKKLEAATWGLFFIWIGLAVVTRIGWGAGLIGVGIVVLGAQALRKYFDLQLEGFWVALGFAFLGGGLCELFSLHLGLVPLLCVAAGIALLVSTVLGEPRD